MSSRPLPKPKQVTAHDRRFGTYRRYEASIQSGKFKERVEITWKYEADSKGMPNATTGKLMEEVQTVLKQAMEKDKLAIFTGILYRRRRTHMGILHTAIYRHSDVCSTKLSLRSKRYLSPSIPRKTPNGTNIGKCASFKIRIMTMKTSMNESDTALNVHSLNEKSDLTYRHIHSVFGSNGMFTWRRRTGRYYYYLCQ